MTPTGIYVLTMDTGGIEVVGEFVGELDGFFHMKDACVIQIPKPNQIGLAKFNGNKSLVNRAHVLWVHEAVDQLVALWRQAKSGLVMPAKVGPNGVPAIPS